jgi:hypothetical protein
MMEDDEIVIDQASANLSKKDLNMSENDIDMVKLNKLNK